MKEWEGFVAKYAPQAPKDSSFAIGTYALAQTLEHVLIKAGRDLSRDSVMKAATSLDNFAPPVILPGIAMSTGPNDYQPMEHTQMMVFKGESWKPIGGIISANSP